MKEVALTVTVHLHESLEKVPGWREMTDYANEHMPDYLEGYEVYVRPASEIEERRFLKDEDGDTSIQFDPEKRRFDLVFSLAEQWSYEELRHLFESTDIPISDNALMGIWMAQGNIGDPVAFAEAQILMLDPLMFEEDGLGDEFDDE